MPKTNDIALVLDAGSLWHQIVIQKQSSTQDSGGDPVDTWDEVLTTRASIAMASGREIYQSGMASQFVSQVIWKIMLRWPGKEKMPAAGMQVAFGVRKFTVQTVENVQERNRVVHLMCLEVNGGGAGCS